MDWHFYIQLASLSIILVYTVMVFRNVNPLTATFICVGLGFLFNLSTPIEIGKIFADSLGSFLALVGFIIMLGRGLGEILNETKVSHTLVYKIIHGIGVDTQKKVKIGVVVSSLVIVAVLGTLAGGLAILAPILRPVAGNVKLSKPSLAILMQAAGEEALILGPFAPPVIAVLGVTNLSYVTLLLYISIPIALVTLIVSWIMANKIQKQYADEVVEVPEQVEEFTPSKHNLFTTMVFLGAFLLAIIYGIKSHATTSYVVMVMLTLSIVVGFVGKLSLVKILELVIEGMKKNFSLFFIFLFLGPMLDLVQSAGGFDALLKLFEPLQQMGGKVILTILIGLTGAFGMPAASAAVIKMLYAMFASSVATLNVPLITFAFSMVLATRITNFAIPGANMFAAMGFAESSNIKAMIKNGLVVASVQIIFLVIYAILYV
jgi:H+/gluconate symporter-like permease